MFINPGDLDAFADIDFAKAQAMIADAEATAISVAPCLVDPEDEEAVNPALTLNQLNVVKGVLRSVVLRWDESGSGGIVQETTGPFSKTVDNRSNRYGRFWPSEIQQLQNVCSTGKGGVFSLSQISDASTHLTWCSLCFGATYCSCGADIAGYPIYENL